MDHEDAVPHLFEYMVPVRFAGDLATEIGAEGPVTVVSTGCTSGLDSVGYAYELIREGSADVMIAGATDAPITPITVACFDAIKATSPNNDNADRASRPFDLNRDGFVLGEGACVHGAGGTGVARRRGAHVYAEIAGFATRSNAYHMTGLKMDGREMAEAIRSPPCARRRSDPTTSTTSTRTAPAPSRTTGTRPPRSSAASATHAYATPVSSIKSMIGHSLGAVGSIELGACALAIEHGMVPPTANLENADPECDLDYVPKTAT